MKGFYIQNQSASCVFMPAGGWRHKILKTWKPALLVLLVSMMHSAGSFAQLSGTYTICSTGSCSYSSLNAAVTDLVAKGVSGPVIFKVSPGTYAEQVSISSFKGASAANTVTFDGTDSTKTIISFAGTSSAPYTVKFSGCSYVTFKRFSILNNVSGSTSAFGVHFTSGASYNTLQSCIVKVDNATTSTGCIGVGVMGSTYSTAGLNGNYNTITNNAIDGGYANVVLYGSSTTSVITGNTVTGNKLTGGYIYGIYSYYSGGFNYSGNNIKLNGASGSISSTTKSSTNYGIYAYYGNNHTISNNIVSANYMGILDEYADYYITGKVSYVYNNIIYGLTSSTSYGLYSYYNVNTKVCFNSVYFTAANGYALYLINSGTASQGTDVRDNIFYKTSPTAYCIYISSSSYVSNLDYNDYYNGGSGYLAYFNGSTFNDLPTFAAGYPALNLNSVTGDPGFANLTPGSEDLHMARTSYGFSGIDMGITTDIDGDKRCKLFPNMGADEVLTGKGKPIVKFFITSNIFPGSPSYVYQTAKAGEPKSHKWYIQNANYGALTKISDSVVLKTTKFTAGSNTLKLVTTSCGGSDSFQMTFNVAAPSAVPVIDFVANKNSILAGDNITFQDLSTNGPTKWTWSFSPDSTVVSGTKVSVLKYIFGNANYQNPVVQFQYSGVYKVCLNASNGVGSGAQNCKTAYITVLPSVNIGNVSLVTDAEGWIFDNGGPNGNYLANTNPSTVIAPCADSVYLTFSMFDMNCGVSFLALYEGKNVAGKRLDPCYGSGSTAGFTGGGTSGAGCSLACLPNTVKPDTFKAKSAMFLSMNAGATATGRGFAAHWWSKPIAGAKKLKANFSIVNGRNDSVCTNGQVNFVNTTVTNPGEPTSFLWDLDGDMSSFECIGTCATAFWPYFLAGPVDVTLIATNCGGSDTMKRTLTVYNPASPKTAIKADNTNPAQNDVVFFTAPIAACVEDYKWTFTKSTGGGYVNFLNGTSNISAAPQVSFPDTGYYDVKLFVDNLSGSQKDSLTIKKYIHVRAGYCVPSVATLNQGMGISAVSLNTMSNVMQQAQQDYTNFTTSQSLSTTLAVGATYPITVSRVSTLVFENLNRSVFIDWNQDGNFTGKGEEAAEDSNSSSVTWTGKITVPKTAKLGATTMRIVVNRGAYSNKPCGQNEFGEYQDYRIYIVPYNIPPVITLTGHQGTADTIKIEQGNPYVEAGYSASSFLYGDVTSRVKRTSRKVGSNNIADSFNSVIPATYLFSYNVADSAGNKAQTQYRVVVVYKDKTPPALIIDQPDTTVMEVTSTPLTPFPAPKVISADDLVDGPLAATVTNDASKVTSNIVGLYTITYTVSDITGNTATVYRYVKIIDTIKPVIKLIGSNPETIEVYNSYADAGYTVSDNYYNGSILNSLVKSLNNVDTSKTGTYYFSYDVTDPSGNKAITVTRTIKVVDTVKPVISLTGLQTDSMEVFDYYNDPGVTASDNYNKTSDIAITVSGTFYTAFPAGTRANKTGTYSIVYTAVDKSGNRSSITRNVKVQDREAPVITLVGSATVTVCRWFNYTDAGYSVSDNYDKASSIKVDTITTGNTLIEGLFSIQYAATDKSGNTSYSDFRYVLVRSANSPNCESGIETGLGLDKYISVYPNPNTGIFYIKSDMPGAENVRISITNMLGAEIAVLHNGVLANGTMRADLSSQPSGVYMLNIVSNSQKLVKRIEITR